jgi:hypothetical protein
VPDTREAVLAENLEEVEVIEEPVEEEIIVEEEVEVEEVVEPEVQVEEPRKPLPLPPVLKGKVKEDEEPEKVKEVEEVEEVKEAEPLVEEKERLKKIAEEIDEILEFDEPTDQDIAKTIKDVPVKKKKKKFW